MARLMAAMIDDAAGGGAPVRSAGRLLREAREKQGLHIAALAASIKVAQRKLESLEGDRLEDLPDATFARALAQTVCRALKIDSTEVLRLLPPAGGHRLENVGEGLNMPFRERQGASMQRDGVSLLASPAFWIVALILIAAAAVYLVPGRWLGVDGRGPASGAPTDSAPTGAAFPPAEATAPLTTSLPASASSTVGDAQQSAPPVPTATSLSAPEAAAAEATVAAAEPATPPPSAAALQLQTSAASWVEVTDGRGASLVARLVQPGEALELDGAAPFRVRIGNAAGTTLLFRGQPIELAAHTRDNVARLELR